VRSRGRLIDFRGGACDIVTAMLRSLASFVCAARGVYVNPLRASSDHVVRSWHSASRRECASVPTSRAALGALRQSSKCYHTQHYRSFSTQDSKSASEPEQSERSLAAAQSGSEAAAQRVVERLGIIPESATAASAESLNESVWRPSRPASHIRKSDCSPVRVETGTWYSPHLMRCIRLGLAGWHADGIPHGQDVH